MSRSASHAWSPSCISRRTLLLQRLYYLLDYISSCAVCWIYWIEYRPRNCWCLENIFYRHFISTMYDNVQVMQHNARGHLYRSLAFWGSWSIASAMFRKFEGWRVEHRSLGAEKIGGLSHIGCSALPRGMRHFKPVSQAELLELSCWHL